MKWDYEIIEVICRDNEWFDHPKDGIPFIMKVKFQKDGELDRVITYEFHEEEILNTATFNTKEE